MSKRVNISIPDDLAERAEAVKDRLGNVSAICARALEREIAMIEATKEKRDGLESAIARLRAGRRNLADESRAFGFKQGAWWASKAADYSELKALLRVKDHHEEHDYDSDHLWTEMKELNRNNDSLADVFQAMRDHESYHGDETLDHKGFWTGFLEGAADLWNQIKDAVED